MNLGILIMKVLYCIVVLKIFRNAVCVRFGFVSCLSSEKVSLQTLETSTINTVLFSREWSKVCSQ